MSFVSYAQPTANAAARSTLLPGYAGKGYAQQEPVRATHRRTSAAGRAGYQEWRTVGRHTGACAVTACNKICSCYTLLSSQDQQVTLCSCRRFHILSLAVTFIVMQGVQAPM